MIFLPLVVAVVLLGLIVPSATSDAAAYVVTGLVTVPILALSTGVLGWAALQGAGWDVSFLVAGPLIGIPTSLFGAWLILR